MKKEEKLPSKNDLLSLLRQYTCYRIRSKRLIELIKAEELAETALEDYRLSNKKDVELVKNAEKASTQRSKVEDQENQLRYRELRILRNELLTKGVSKKLVDDIQATVKKFEHI